MSITNMLSVANVTDQKREGRTRKRSVIQIHIYVIKTNWFEVASRDVTHSLFPDDATDTTETTLIGYLAVEIGRQSITEANVLEVLEILAGS